MVTTNAIQRTFNIRRTMRGTAFTVDRAGRQYLVTARHVVEGIGPGETIELWSEDRWRALEVNIVGIGQGELDVAVFAATFQISPTFRLELDSRVTYGQEAYFLGFPHGRHSDGAEINRGLPIPFVKSGIISAMTFGDVNRVYIDAHGNRGFSGGPVVYHPQREQTEPNELCVAGVVAEAVMEETAIHDAAGNHVANLRENAGFVVAVGIEHVRSLIDANPVGFELPTG